MPRLVESILGGTVSKGMRVIGLLSLAAVLSVACDSAEPVSPEIRSSISTSIGEEFVMGVEGKKRVYRISDAGLALPNGKVIVRFSGELTRQRFVSIVTTGEEAHRRMKSRAAVPDAIARDGESCLAEEEAAADAFYAMTENANYLLENWGNANVSLEGELALLDIQIADMIQAAADFVECVCLTTGRC